MKSFQSLFWVASVAAAASAHGAIVANFDGGSGSGSVDAYLGAAGQGWVGPWVRTGTSNTVAVANTNPLTPGSGNYLAITAGTTSGTGSSSSSWNRQYGAASGDVSLSLQHTISWSFRVDETLGATFGAGTDRYQFFGLIPGTSGTTNLASSSTTNEWFVYGSGAAIATGASGSTYTALNWTFYNGGATTAFDSGTTVDSGIAIVPGTVYNFTIVNDPATKSYVGTISNGVTSYTSPTLSWRNKTGTGSGGFFVASLSTSTSGETRSGSLDNILIVPEPSSSLLLLGGAALAVSRRRRSL